MGVSKHRKNHAAKAAQRRREHELKRHRTAQLGAKIQDAIEAYKAQEQMDAARPPSVSLTQGPLASNEIFPNAFPIL